MTHSVYSQKLDKSEVLLDQVSQSGKSKMHQIEGVIGEDLLRAVWNSFGLYVSRQLRMGRGISLAKFGTFSFSAPEISLNGVTNPIERDKRLRLPVFIVSKEFVKGKVIKSGIGNPLSGLRPYSVFGSNGSIQQTKANYTEIGHYANVTKDQAKMGVDRIVRQLSDKAKMNETVEMEIPSVGIFLVRGGVCGVIFNEFLIKNSQAIPQKPLEERKKQGEMNLTIDSLKQFDIMQSLGKGYEDKSDDFLQIEGKAKDYLLKNLDINIQQMEEKQRAQSVASSRAKLGKMPKPLAENWMETQSATKSVRERPQTAKEKSMTLKFSELDSGIKKLTFWIRQSNFDTEDSFIELCSRAMGSCNHTSRLTSDNFALALSTCDINLTPLQLTALFNHLDVNKDGYIDYADWSRIIKEQGNHLQYIKDVISKGQLKTDDVLKRMNLTREQKALTMVTLKDALKALDITLNEPKAFKLAQSILKDKEFIEIKDLIDLLECFEEEGKIYDINWFNNILSKLKHKLASLSDSELLRKEFENYDDRNQGILDTANFKTCLMKAKIDLSVGEINRLCRYIDKNSDGTIDYYKFLDHLSKISKELKEGQFFKDLADFTEQMKIYLDANKINPMIFIRKVLNFSKKNDKSEENKPDNSLTSKVSSETLAAFIYRNVFPNCFYNEICYYVEKADIDQDGFVDTEDFTIFLNRHKYFNKRPSTSNPMTQSQKIVNNVHFEGTKSQRGMKMPEVSPGLFPREPLDEAKADIVIRDLRQALFFKNFSFFDFFKILDNNKDGFITIEEFCQGMDKVIKFSQPIKEGFFSYMDKQKIGMIDYKAYLFTMNKSIFTKQAEVSEDNWQWQMETINKIREWYRAEAISLFDAFRTVDKDFDGFINKSDLKTFLVEVLKFQESEITIVRIDRLFKLIDQFKRGCIQFIDFKRLIQENIENINLTITGGKTLPSSKSSFDWIVNCKQQIGLVLSRQFPTLKDSFESISLHQKRLLYSQFYKWLDDSRALTGFNLTEKLVQEVFSDLDPHKKGYLTENDWLNAFGGYIWTNKMFNELRETINTSFKDLHSAFHFFCKNESLSEIPFDYFKDGINSLFPNRFSFTDIFWLWNKVKNGSQSLNFPQFSLYFEKSKNSRPKTAGISLNSLKAGGFNNNAENANVDNANGKSRLPQNNEDFTQSIIDKVRQILRSSDKTIEQVFKEFDKDGSGSISNVEFRNAFRDMNLGLSMAEIDQLQNVCDENMDGMVDWLEFVKKFKLSDTGERILERSKLKLQKIREDIYYYMISPKDAFRLFNENRTGKMTYEQFTNFLIRLCQLSGTDLYPHPIISDLFNFIDVRKDGVIDLNEWMQTFKMMQKTIPIKARPVTAMQSLQRNIDQQYKVKKAVIPFNILNLLRSQDQPPPQENYDDLVVSSKWETTKQYDQIIKTIARNRKHLTETFANIVKKDKNVSFEKAKEIISELLRSVGLYVPEEFWPYLLKFAQREGSIDYKFMLDVYKERITRVDSHPKLTGSYKNL